VVRKTRLQHHVAGFDSVYTAYDFVDRKLKVRRGHSARPNSTAHSYLLREDYVECPLPPRRNQKRVENWDKFSNFKNKRQCARVDTAKMNEWPS
jgi:hypothetical protein